MEEAVSVKQKDALIFGEDLFADLMSLHPVFRSLSPVVSKNRGSFYDHVIGKCVFVLWLDIRDVIKANLRKDFPGFAKTEDTFREYLKVIADSVLSSTDGVCDQVFVLCAALFEVISFLYRRGMTNFIHYAPHYWLFMFDSIKSDEFHKKGGWYALRTAAEKQAEYYKENEDELLSQYWLESSSISEISRSFNSGESSKNVRAGDSTEVSSGELTEETAPIETLSAEKRDVVIETSKEVMEDEADSQEQLLVDKRDIGGEIVKESKEKESCGDQELPVEESVVGEVKEDSKRIKEHESPSSIKSKVRDETIKDLTEEKPDHHESSLTGGSNITDTIAEGSVEKRLEPTPEPVKEVGDQKASTVQSEVETTHIVSESTKHHREEFAEGNADHSSEMSKDGAESAADAKKSTKQTDSGESSKDAASHASASKAPKVTPKDKQGKKDAKGENKLYKSPKAGKKAPAHSSDQPLIKTPSSSSSERPITKSKSVTPKPSRPVPKASPGLTKTPTDRGDLAKFQSKSCDQQEKPRGLSLTKSSKVSSPPRRTVSEKNKPATTGTASEAGKIKRKSFQPPGSRTQASSKKSSVPEKSKQNVPSSSASGTSGATPGGACAAALDTRTEVSRPQAPREAQSEKPASNISTKPANRGRDNQGRSTPKDPKDSKNEKQRWR